MNDEGNNTSSEFDDVEEVEDFTAEHVGLIVPTVDAAVSRHLKRLVANWGLLSDLSFSDLLLYVPLSAGDKATDDHKFVIVNQVRPNTGQTLFVEDVVGRLLSADQRPVVATAFATGSICQETVAVRSDATDIDDVDAVDVTAIPVRYHGQVVAVLGREAAVSPHRLRSPLEAVYHEVFERLALMVSEGGFPDEDEEVLAEGGPRVGDGVVLLDSQGKVSFTSPNANSALRRLGVTGQIMGESLSDMGAETSATYRSFFSARPAVEEVERDEITVILRSIPLLEDAHVTGAVVLVRDISELRNRDRMLVSKDATIKEIHHRVKNNLQTISSLLRLQGRRLTEPSAKAAVEESVRRIRSIALVHETLSREDGDDVNFGDIVRPLVRMVEDGLTSPERPVRFQIHGHSGKLPSPMATSLAVVVTELLQNVMDHAYPPGLLGSDDEAHIEIVMDQHAGILTITVRDDGVGISDDFDVDSSGSLGLSIVRGLVAELEGTISFSAAAERGDTSARQGTIISVAIPVVRSPESDAERPPRGGGRSVGL